MKEKPGNVFVSPLSVSNGLVLLSQAAEGNTFEQLKRGLHLGNDKSISATQYHGYRKTLEKSAGQATFTIANRIYVQQGHQLNKNFEAVAVSKFKSGVETLNFAESGKSAATINHFVEKHTNGKIKKLMSSDQLSGDTCSVLVNAIYFKAPWKKPFLWTDTIKANFYNSKRKKVKVDFMYKLSHFNGANLNNLNATALELKYEYSSMSFIIVLPKSRTGLSKLESKLKNYDLAKITKNLKRRKYKIYIPKFKIEYEIELNDVLKSV